jgi:hypothetical protein
MKIADSNMNAVCKSTDKIEVTNGTITVVITPEGLTVRKNDKMRAAPSR